jgi:hypothetical protein
MGICVTATLLLLYESTDDVVLFTASVFEKVAGLDMLEEELCCYR